MVLATDLRLFIGRSKATPTQSHLDKKLPKGSVIFRLANAPSPLTRGIVGKLLMRGCGLKNISGSIYDIAQHVFSTYCKEYQFLTLATNCIIMANGKTLHRLFCKECGTLTNFSIAFDRAL